MHRATRFQPAIIPVAGDPTGTYPLAKEFSCVCCRNRQRVGSQSADSPHSADRLIEHAEMHTLHRYDARFSRTYDRLLKALVALKAKREKKEA
jgi:hypothetical protein